MESTNAVSSRVGRLERQQMPGESFYAFIPKALPPDPPLRLDNELQELLERANRALGRLEGITLLLPDPTLFLYMYVRKEAVLSSQIEGTQSSISDLLLHESEGAPGVPTSDVREVSNYVDALQYGLDRLKGGFPISLRLIREIHKILLTGVRGHDKMPGEFRTSQNWLGGTRPGNARFVPPPAHEVMPCMGALEKFLHGDPVRMPLLIKTGLAHVQFESIHPFLDGNGRIGRLLITFLFCAEGALSQPLLYLSLYFKRHRQAYYDTLQNVRAAGAWEDWLRFYLEGIEEVSDQATETAGRIVRLFEADRADIQKMGRAAASAYAVHELLKKKAITSIPMAAAELHVSRPTVAGALRNMAKLGIVREFTGRPRNRRFVYDTYLAILNEGTES